MYNYKKLNVWKDSVDLVTEIYVLTNDFPEREKFGLISQINRCSVSIPSNIAEGAGRNSKKEFSLFLGYALASSFELETQLIISNNLKFISDEQKENHVDKLNMIQRKLHSLIKSLK
ncbi:four helix bundle protein [Winogradskyella ouciana]|uniref:Four helix bundle protein n=1 Tax=Winogradskyella ouciana TaxID=2608631 RepID=A0A7K1G808_9FLAO|nr:four helix bundle protein [Winogradskyella ouciana]MTE25417.1 four helix bundle protein [Winogradskyella ouciana]